MVAALTTTILLIYFFLLFTAVFWLLIWFENRKLVFKDPKPKKLKPLTIVIPAYNEEKTIASSIDSCLNLTYPKGRLKIIVVNDGSTDGTRKVCERYAKRGKIKLLNQKNQGKAAAINNALKYITTPYMACLDADSFFEKDALPHILGYLDDPEVAASIPSIKITRHKTFAERLQWVEYLFSIYLRKLMSFIDALYVIPGPGSVYKTEVIKKVGGFDTSSLTEDMEIAFKVQDLGYRIENTLNAYVHTVAPPRMRQLMKQRLRWYIGYFETIKKHKHFILNKKFQNLGLFLLPINFVFIAAIFLIVFIALYQFLNGLWKAFLTLRAANYDLLSFIEPPDLSTFLFGIDVMSVFLIISTFLAIVVIYLSIRMSGEPTDLRGKGKHYLLYFLFYFPILSIFWIMSTLYAISRREWKWRGESLR